MYGGMLGLRTHICGTSAFLIAKIAGIAARYSFKRRQFGHDQNDEETTVILYQMQQYKVVPSLSTAFAIQLAFDKIQGMKKNFESLKATNMKESFKALAELHKTVSVMKALVCWKGVKFGEQTKLACGGHGFLNAAGLSEPHNDIAIGWVSAEGDGTVLVQQTGKILLKEVMTGKLKLDEFEFFPSDKLTTEE